MPKNRPGYKYQLAGILLLLWQSVSADNHLTATFQARYDLYNDGEKIAETILKVDKSNDRIRWQSTILPGGLYALITSQQPYTESILLRTKDDYRLSSIRISKDIKESPEEVAEFDWQHLQLLATRKNKHIKRPLTNAVYDYLSIHWLAAQMSLANADRYTLTFYRRGKLVKSTLFRTGTETLEIGGKTVGATVYEQSFEGSSRRLTYHYDKKNYWLPLKVQRFKKGKKASVMRLKSLDTKL